MQEPIGRQGIGGPLDRLYSSKPSKLVGNAQIRDTHGLGQYTWYTWKFIALKFVSCSETSYNKHRHVLLNICVQFHNYHHPLRISLLKTCSKGIQFFIKCTFYTRDTFCKSSWTRHSSSTPEKGALYDRGIVMILPFYGAMESTAADCAWKSRLQLLYSVVSKGWGILWITHKSFPISKATSHPLR
jgi:hypothetical protein